MGQKCRKYRKALKSRSIPPRHSDKGQKHLRIACKQGKEKKEKEQ